MSSDSRTAATAIRARRRPLYAAPPPPGGHSRSHSVLGYWVPLVTIGTIAVGGLAAWIWSERGDHDDHVPPRAGRPPPATGGSWAAGGASSAYDDATPPLPREQHEKGEPGGLLGMVQGALRRTPSPQHFFDAASKQLMGRMAAAGAALSSIIENPEARDHSGEGKGRDEREAFSDHQRWSEEADGRRRTNIPEAEHARRSSSARAEKATRRSRRTVAVVLSADVRPSAADNDAFHSAHASILSHLPSTLDPEATDLFVLLYAPHLTDLPKPEQATSALGSSYSAISTPAHTPGSELQSISPRVEPSNPTFDALYNHALSLVSHPTQIMPFTTPAGYVPMLKHLSPQLVYISDALSGHQGETVARLKGWVGQTVVVVGDEGPGGRADTETETEDESKRQNKAEQRWWEGSGIVGLGKEVDVVDAVRVADDWAQRVNGRE